MNNYGNEYNSVTYSENFAEHFAEVPWSTGNHSAETQNERQERSGRFPCCCSTSR